MSPDVNIAQDSLGGEFIPRLLTGSDFVTQIDRLFTIVNYGAVVSDISVNASRSGTKNPEPTISDNPAWRDAGINVVVGTNVTDLSIYNYAILTSHRTLSSIHQKFNIEGQTLVTHLLLPGLKNLTSDGGAYLNAPDAHRQAEKMRFTTTTANC